MRLLALIATIPFVLAACGGDDAPILYDAPPPDAPPPDSEPEPLCSAPTPDDCDGVCTHLGTDEQNCGSCGNPCQGGAYCSGGGCMCPAAFVPASPTFLQSQMIDQDPILIGAGGFLNAGVHLLAAGVEVGVTEIGQPYQLSEETLGTAPFLGAFYNYSPPLSFDAAYLATAGTVTFTAICDVGLAGTATGVTFRGVSGTDFNNPNPMIDPEGCSFEVASVTFRFGETCPPEQEPDPEDP
jgi:hypothetical protein